jgi:hypothetical protein
VGEAVTVTEAVFIGFEKVTTRFVSTAMPLALLAGVLEVIVSAPGGGGGGWVVGVFVQAASTPSSTGIRRIRMVSPSVFVSR